MNHYFITGTSSGIGKALALRVLEDPANRVTGISRTSTIAHDRYMHVKLDLAEEDKISKYAFEGIRDCDKAILVNNAATLGPVRMMGKQSAEEISTAFRINTISPALLMNTFIGLAMEEKTPALVLNITSGAASRPVDGWSSYCASKAALNMITEVAHLECQLHQQDHIQIIAVAPGVVDTPMQSTIRSSDKEDFSRVEDFRQLKSAKQLRDPEWVANELFKIILNAPHIDESIIRI